ncbi:MAG: hypothetical protein AAGA03_17990 [Planctomycetota bacterium]
MNESQGSKPTGANDADAIDTNAHGAQPSNPYASVAPPSVVASAGAAASNAANQVIVRPTGLTVIGVLALLAGFFGLLFEVVGLAYMLFGQAIQKMMTAGAPVPEPQQRFNDALADVMDLYFVPNLIFFVVGIGLSLAYLGGGYGILSRKAWSRGLMSKVLIVSMGLELLRAIVGVLVQMQTIPITQTFMRDMAGGGNSPPGMEQIMQFAMYFGLAFSLVWVAAKVALMFWGYRYLKRPDLDAYFSR